MTRKFTAVLKYGAKTRRVYVAARTWDLALSAALGACRDGFLLHSLTERTTAAERPSRRRRGNA